MDEARKIIISISGFGLAIISYIVLVIINVLPDPISLFFMALSWIFSRAEVINQKLGALPALIFIAIALALVSAVLGWFGINKK